MLSKRKWKKNSLCLCIFAAFVIISWDLVDEDSDEDLNPREDVWEKVYQRDDDHHRIIKRNIDNNDVYYLNPNLTCRNKDISFRRGHAPVLGQKFVVLYNFVRAEKWFNCNETVTYTTHATPDYLYHLEDLLERWDGPISLAIFAPGNDCSNYRQCLLLNYFHSCKCTGRDYEEALKAIVKIRNCGETAKKTRELVTFHIYFEASHPPSKADLKRTIDSVRVNCERVIQTTYKKEHGLDYPVNVARNVARLSANSHFVFPSDIELLPSPGAIGAFLAMIARYEKPQQRPNPKLYVLPIFEVSRKVSLPNTKRELVDLLWRKRAVIFHQRTCPKCQRIPGHYNWTQDIDDERKEKIFLVAKRHYPYNRFWEPIFICSNEAPLYNERLSWEGRKDKMSHALELCLRDYDFQILNNAFLVHKGIKSFGDFLGRVWQHKIHMQTKVVMHQIVPYLHKDLGYREGCSKIGQRFHA